MMVMVLVNVMMLVMFHPLLGMALMNFHGFGKLLLMMMMMMRRRR